MMILHLLVLGTSLLLLVDSIFAFSQPSATNPSNLRVAIIGAGPSGQLLSHLLLKYNEDSTNNSRNNNDSIHSKRLFNVTLVDCGPDPRTKNDESRAYALGIGIRGRTAIREGVDDDLWQAVKRRGYESERFQLQLFGGKVVIPLRSEADSKNQQQGVVVEPSVLMYQSGLCASLMDELERRNYEDRGWLRVFYDCRIKECDLTSMKLLVENDAKNYDALLNDDEKFDLIVGCDGVNSVVRQAIKEHHPNFDCTKRQLPGEFKVVRLDLAPPDVDPSSVSLILPKSGSTTAFVEPTSQNGECCILFAGRNADDPILSESSNVTMVEEALKQSFPQWEPLARGMAEQLVAQTRPGQASSVTCSTYHYRSRAVLVGDAAHATGGVSGQGVNSALADALALAQCLIGSGSLDSIDNRKDGNDVLADSLLAYSVRQVPEGKALYDLSFGPNPRGVKAVQWTLMNLRDTVFRGRWGVGRPPLQTRLTTSLTPFSSIRREFDDFYDDSEAFPPATVFERQLRDLHEHAMTSGNSKL